MQRVLSQRFQRTFRQVNVQDSWHRSKGTVAHHDWIQLQVLNDTRTTGRAVYHAARNQFERIRGFSELISRFEFEFSRGENYIFERFEFLVCSKFNHTPCGCKCACAVACLCPHDSISNVVVSLMIHDNIYIYIYIYFGI